MVHRGFCGVNSLNTSQALSRVVEVAQGVFLTAIFAFGLGFEERPLVSSNRSRRLEFALPFIAIVFIGHIRECPSLWKPAAQLVNRLWLISNSEFSESFVLLPRKIQRRDFAKFEQRPSIVSFQHGVLESRSTRCLRKNPCKPGYVSKARSESAGMTNRAFSSSRGEHDLLTFIVCLN